MNATIQNTEGVELQWDLSALRRSWSWFLVLGVLLIGVGVIALTSVVIASLATAVMIGCLLLFAGVIEIVGAFWSRRWNGFVLQLLSGLLSAAVGVMFIWAPLDAALTLTMFLACLLMVAGIFEIVASASYRFEGWGWPMVSGFIDLVLGLLIWMAWPASGLWVIGMFVGISLVFRGLNWIGLAMALRVGACEASISRQDRHSPIAGTPAHPGH